MDSIKFGDCILHKQTKELLLIDADMRKCGLHNIFQVSPCPGLSNYLSGVNETNQEVQNLDNYLRETEVPNLYLMPSGNVPPNPIRIAINSTDGKFIRKIKKIYQI